MAHLQSPIDWKRVTKKEAVFRILEEDPNTPTKEIVRMLSNRGYSKTAPEYVSDIKRAFKDRQPRILQDNTDFVMVFKIAKQTKQYIRDIPGFRDVLEAILDDDI